MNVALVAHSTSPSTSSRWRCQSELGDRAAHRVADGDEAVDAQLAGEGGDVVGAVLEAERLGRAQAAAVAAVVDGDDAEVLGERARSRRTS